MTYGVGLRYRQCFMCGSVERTLVSCSHHVLQRRQEPDGGKARRRGWIRSVAHLLPTTNTTGLPTPAVPGRRVLSV